MAGGTGKRKIEIKKKEKAADRMVTFSKRRKGLFKKVTQLHSKTAAKAAVAVFSPGGRLYTHGEPSFDSVIDHLVGNLHPQENNVDRSSTACTSVVDDGREEGSDTAAFGAKMWLESLQIEEYDNLEEVLSLLNRLEEIESNFEDILLFHALFD